ncbi:MAG: NAD-glutamate dehydrogenase, partial [Alphaproteobacteria bacterium]
MPRKGDNLKSRVLSALAARAKAAGGAGADEIAAFTRIFYAGLSVDDLRRRSADSLFHSAAGMWAFARQRRRGTAKIGVHILEDKDRGHAASRTVIQIVNDDMPFLVDSVSAELVRRNAVVQLLVHPVVLVRRDRSGRMLALADGSAAMPPPAGAQPESFMHIEIGEVPKDAQDELKAAITNVLTDVRVVVADWKPMVARVDEALLSIDKTPLPLHSAELAEAKAFLEWIRNDHFTFHGLRSYDLITENGAQFLRPIKGTGLGLLRTVSEESAARHEAPLTPALAEFARRKELLILAKATTRSTVHRAVPLDFIGIRRFDEKGDVVGEHRILGLYTSMAYSQSPRYIPLVREKVRRVIARAGYSPSSHDGKALLRILETYPRDELFQCPEDVLFDTALEILRLHERPRVALFVRQDPFGNYASCLVFVPRDRYTTALRLRFQDILERAFAGSVNASYVQVSDEILARVHVIVSTKRGEIPAYDPDAIEAELTEAARSWCDRLHEALAAQSGEAAAAALLARYADAFPAGYQERYAADEAIFDLSKIESVRKAGGIAMHLYRPKGAVPADVRLKIYRVKEPEPLSDILPVLEHMGFHVVTELPFPVAEKGAAEPVWIQEFGMHPLHGAAVHVDAIKANFEECLTHVLSGAVEDDGFNALVVTTGLGWREVVVLRALCKYLRQARIPFSESYMQETLLRNPEITRNLVDLFLTRFDPRDRARSESRAVSLRVAIEEALDSVASLDEDRILRRFYNLVQVALRTNHFQRASDGEPKPYLSIKFDSRNIDALPAPRPMFEIFVYSPTTEGIHLRGGKVARGGIRWSDRREDFRTEILGLMKAQMVKNAVIVPVGSKGGFVMKRPPPPSAGREALNAEVVECYRTLIRGMLDLTDNLKGNKIVAPKDTIRYDDDDPYLVVAADKGTATFSDIANGLSQDHGFWLGDAFASGGSAGYDHKKMGITARGAWEAVKRHFREFGRDIQREDFTVMGVGDMSGDVFGNGMLLSKHTKLVGAFNHLHIFADPDPDPKTSFAERKRLFGLARSSWTDYRQELISKGGGVFDRKAKGIKLTPQMKERFGIAGESVTPSALVQAMLCANVDLLWFGGIGTFVRATHETDAEVGDRANDAVRVKARDLRCRVVGEGANLGVTQAARTEYALLAGRINTDAIDNSGGVDCSDHEVNIKILLNDLVARGDLARRRRDALLRQMTDEVADLVLRDNYLQTQAISVDAARGVAILDQSAHLMRTLERQGKLDRTLEYLPDDEILAERLALKRGLMRPEIAVLLAYAKISLYSELVETDLPDDPLLVQDLVRYFPGPLQKKYGRAIERHRLRREIIATSVANSLVNRVGAAFVNEMKERTGMDAAETARAYAITRDVFQLRDLWSGIEALDNKVAAADQTAMLNDIMRLVDHSTLWFLTHGARPLDITAICATFSPAVASLRARLGDIVAPTERSALDRRTKELMEKKVPEPIARTIAALDPLESALDIVRIADKAKLEVDRIGRLYFAIGMRFGIDRLRDGAEAMVTDSPWQRQAIAAIVGDLYGHQRDLTTAVLASAGEK